MKKLFLVLGITFLSSILFAQKGKSNNSLLWKISGKGIKEPSYLFGTIHVICDSNYLWTDAMKNAFNSTKKLCLELPMNGEGFQLEIGKAIMLPDSLELKDFFSEAQYDSVNTYFTNNMGTDIAALKKFKPFGLSSFLILKMVNCNGKIPVAYENKLMGYANEQNMEITGLETIEEQFKIFDDQPKERQAEIIMSSIRDMQKQQELYNAMMAAYLKQDISALYKLITQSPEYKDMLDVMIYNRNAKWIPAMLTMAKQEPVFFAVGAGHLGGDKGVIKLLRKEGYKVEAVK